jgi:predicted PurR-regulated permease PerM
MSDVPQYTPASTQRALKWAIFIAAAVLVVYLCLLVLGPFLNVIAWSSVLAITFYPMRDYFVRKTGRVSLSAFICSTLVVVAVVIPLIFVGGLAVDQLLALADSLQRAFTDETGGPTVGPLRGAFEWLDSRLGVDVGTIVTWVRQHANELAREGAEFALAIAANVTGAVVSFVFIIFAMFLLFRDGDQIAAAIPDLLPFDRVRSEAMLLRIRDVIYGGMYGVVVISLIQGVVCGLMFWILGIPSAVLWGVVTLLTSVLPIVGAAAVWVPAAVYLAVTGYVTKAIILAVCGALVISGVDNFLRPKLVGGRVGLSELVMFFALLGGLQVFGLLGIVLGPLLFAVARSMVDVLREGNWGQGGTKS